MIVDEESLEQGEFIILGYFSLALKVLKFDEDLSKSLRKKLDGLYKDIEQTPVYLIGQLGKNENYKDEISGDELIDYAVSVILKAHQMIGGRIILVETEPIDKLVGFYEGHGFIFLQQPDLVQMVKFLP